MKNSSEFETTAVSDIPSPPPQGLGRLLVKGSSALGLATLLERGLSFGANIVAARLGGTHVFGAYSVAMTTANNVASYAGAGIGTTANRFSGEYPYGSSGYRGLVRTLAMVSIGSAILAALILWFASAPLADHLIRNPPLAGLLRLAAISAGAIILLECLRGLLIGQRRFAALMTLSALFGGGLVIVLPLAARSGPSAMVIGQAAVALSAIFICVIAARQLKFTPPSVASSVVRGPTPAAIVRFGFVQLIGMIGLNAAGWWVASLVARSDVSLAQAGLYSVALQFRNISAMPSGLIAQTVYAQLTEGGAEEYGGADRVTIVSTILATLVSLFIAGCAVALIPWVLPRLYGHAFLGAELASTLAISTGLIHMSAAPAAARLTVVSLPFTGMINAGWSVVVIALGTWLVPLGGAAEATWCLLAAHVVAALAVLIALFKLRSASSQLAWATMPAVLGSLILAILGSMRAGSLHKGEYSVAMLTATAVLLWITFEYARRSSPAFSSVTWSSLISALRGSRRFAL